MEAAAMNVFVNTKSLKNREEADKINAKMDDLLGTYLPKAKLTAEKVMGQIR